MKPRHCDVLARRPRQLSYGGAGVLAMLAELLFIEVLRLYINEQADGRTGWLAWATGSSGVP